jgi:hypothetical protein
MKRQIFYESSQLARGYRLTKPTRSEQKRVANTWTARIGADLRETIRRLAQETGLTQGEIGRVLLLAGLAELEAGRVSFENGSESGAKGADR